MKKIIVVYHAYMFGREYMAMMLEQFRLLLTTELYGAAEKIYISLIDSPKKYPSYGEEWVNSFWKFSSSKVKDEANLKVEIKKYVDNKEETNTLKWIAEYAKSNPGDYVLYFHTKGITVKNEATEDWRHYMEYFVVEHWRDCVKKLDEGYDCCGVLWNTDTLIGQWPHFSGNMWWAKTDYINTLQSSYLDDPWRFYREFWIGSGLNVKAFEFHNSRLNDKATLIAHKGHYDVKYPRINYEK